MLGSYGIAFVLVRPACVGALGLSESSQLGLFKMLDLPTYFEAAIGFLLFDLTFYYWHAANHKFGFLWRWHNIHHLDPDLDVTSSFRFHFVEVAYSTPMRVLQVLFIGAEPLTFFTFELVFQCATFFHHSNVRIPIALERVLNIVFVTPRMHGIHHSQVREETDSNYSVIFSFWDRWHKSFVANVPVKYLEIGVPAYSNQVDNQILKVLSLPFVKQRDYWLKENRHVVRDPSQIGSRTEILAE